MNRFANTTTCDWCKRITVHATKWTRFTNLFKRTRIVRINKNGPTPGLMFPGEKVRLLQHEPSCPESQPIDWNLLYKDREAFALQAMTANCNCDTAKRDHLLLPNLVSCSTMCWCQRERRLGRDT